jgi:dTDP-4-dehydrorhamnose reductase
MKILRPNKTDTADAFARGCGVINIASSEITSWHGFATAIVAGMKQPAIALETEHVTPIETARYPTKATRPRNSRLDLGRLHEVFGIETLSWRKALDVELDQLASANP